MHYITVYTVERLQRKCLTLYPMYQIAGTKEQTREQNENNWKNKENKKKNDVLSNVSNFILVSGFGVLQIIYIKIT